MGAYGARGKNHEETVYAGSPTPVIGRGRHGSQRVALNERPKGDGVPPDIDARGVPPGCPDAEHLAEYADGLLDAEARQAIEAHLVTCPDCRAVLVETVAFLGAEAEAAGVVSTLDTSATPDTPAMSDTPAISDGAATPTTPGSAQPGSVQATDAGVEPTIGPARVVPFRTRSWVTGVGATLAAAAALVLIVRIAAPAWMPSWLGGGPPLDALVAALDTQQMRPVEGRLMGGFAYAAPPSPTRGGADRLGRRWSPEVQVAAAEIAKFAEGNTSPRARAALGVALIVAGELDEAITTLQAVAKDAPDDAAVQTNLSAAYLARARWFNHAEDWPKALTAADRAVALDPNAPEPYFNRALAYEGLDQTERAERAWADYTSRDRGSAWTREAEERKKALSRES